MNKNFKKKIAVLSAVLSICSAQNSKPVSAENKNLVKLLAIGIPLLLGGAGLIWGGFELANYLKNKNNDQENKNPDGGIKFLAGKEKQDAEKLMDNFISQEWIFDKEAKCFCKCINYDNIKSNKLTPNGVYYKNYLFEKKIDINSENIDDINNKAGYHIQKMGKIYNENKNSGLFRILKSISGSQFEILEFDIPNCIRIRVEYDIKSKKPLSLELFFLNKNVDNIDCHWYFVHKDIANN